jgi:penicillin G amidase
VASKRVLKYLNITIGVVAVLALCATWWFAWRPLPQTSGAVRAAVSAKATVERDALGVPHITAATIEDALFLQGYTAAQDRLWQMDVLRRVAAGRLAEVVGPAALEADREARRMRMERIAEQHAALLAAADRAVLAAYARGVNAFLETHRNKLPLEFSLLRYDPRPWGVKDSLLIGLYMYRGLTQTWRKELQKAALLEGGDAAKVNFLFPDRAGGEVHPGSNAWVLGGARTASGRPLLANDPHLEYSIPGIWHMVHLKAPGLDVAGVALPGVPCVILGHNQRIGWGVTNLQFDVQDLYVEKLDPQSGAYAFAGKLKQARLEREIISVKGGAPVEFAQWVTRHGPVFREGNRFLALRWAAAEPAFTFPLLDLNRAGNFQEFTAALARYPGPGQNFVYADVDGNIGYQATGRLPIRKTFDGSVPVDGSTGEYEWVGFIPFEQLPRSYNPASGLIVTANQNPFPDGYSYRVSGNFSAPYRSTQIYNLLSRRKGWRAQEMAAVQKDVYSGFCELLARQIVAAYDRRGMASQHLADAVKILRSWNGQMEGGPASMIVTLTFEQLRKAVGERASPGKGADYDVPMAAGVDSVQMAPVAIEKLLRERPKEWFADYDQLLLRAFLDAMEEGRRMQGGNVSKWDYGRYNQLLIEHPVLSRLPLVGKYFNIGPVEQSGSTTTVKQTTRRMGPSMRMAVDFANLDRSLLILPAGESGQILSGHYKDQWEAWQQGRGFPMQFGKVEGKGTLVVEPE